MRIDGKIFKQQSVTPTTFASGTLAADLLLDTNNFNLRFANQGNDRFVSNAVGASMIQGNTSLRFKSAYVPDIAFVSQIGTAFSPNVASLIRLDPSSGKIYVHAPNGSFNGTPYNSLVKLDPSTGTIDATFNTNIGTGLQNNVGQGTIKDIAFFSDGSMMLVGPFISLNGTTAHNIVRVNSNGTIDTSFNSGSGCDRNGIQKVRIDQSGTKIYIAGDFTTYNGTNCGGLIRLNLDGSVDTTFTTGSGFDVPINNLNVGICIDQNNQLVYGMIAVTTYNGLPVKKLVRFNNNGTIDTAFDIGTGFSHLSVSPQINDVREHSGSLYVGGLFDTYNGLSADDLIKLDYSGVRDTGFVLDPSRVGQVVTSIDASDSTNLFVQFQAVNGLYKFSNTTGIEDQIWLDQISSYANNSGPWSYIGGYPYLFSLSFQGRLIIGDTIKVFGSIMEYDQDYGAGNLTLASIITKGYVDNSINQTGGGSNVFQYSGDLTNQSTSDPGLGKIKWNNVDPNAATQIYIDQRDNTNVIHDGYFSLVTPGTILYIQKRGDVTVYQRWVVTSATNNSGWWTFNVTLIEWSTGFTSANNANWLTVSLGGFGAGASVISGSAITIAGGQANLGGAMTGAVNIAGGGFIFNMGTSSSNLNRFNIHTTGDSDWDAGSSVYIHDSTYKSSIYLSNGSGIEFHAGTASTYNTSNLYLSVNGLGDTLLSATTGFAVIIAGGSSNQVSIQVKNDANQFIITDNRVGVDQSGIEYLTNYSANFTARSLVDKAYVDAAISGGGVASGNAITIAGGQANLGGTMTADVNINGHFNFGIGQFTTVQSFNATASNIAGSNFSDLGVDQYSAFMNYYYGFTLSAVITLDQTGVHIISNAGITIDLGGDAANSCTITDTRTGSNQSGIAYGGDYSPFYTARSLVDKAYVSGAFWPLGGTALLTNNVAIDGAFAIRFGDTTVPLTTFDVVAGMSDYSTFSQSVVTQDTASLRSFSESELVGELTVGLFSVGQYGIRLTSNSSNPSNSTIVLKANGTSIITSQTGGIGASLSVTSQDVTMQTTISPSFSTKGIVIVNYNGINLRGTDLTNYTDFQLSYNNAVFTDNTAIKSGIEYNATGYVTALHSLTDKEYVDALVAGVITTPQTSDKHLSPAATTTDNQTTGLAISHAPKGLIIIALNGLIVDLGNGIKTRDCYFSADAGVTAKTFATIVSGDTLYWNSIITTTNLAITDLFDFFYI